MYFTKRIKLSGEAIDSITIQLKATGLRTFFCLENNTFFNLTVTNTERDIYTLIKANSRLFVPDGYVTFYALPEDAPVFPNNLAFYQYLLAYIIYSNFGNLSIDNPFRDLFDELTFPKILAKSSLTTYSEYHGYLMQEFLAGRDKALAGNNNGTLVFRLRTKPGDNIMVAQMTENVDDFTCHRSIMLEDYIKYGDTVVVPNFASNFRPTHFLRCSSKFVSFDGLYDMPLSVEHSKPIKYEVAGSLRIPEYFPDLNPFFRYSLFTDEGNEVLTDAQIATTRLELVKSAPLHSSLLISYGPSQAQHRGISTIRIFPTDYGLPKLTFNLPANLDDKLVVTILTVLNPKIQLQQLATSGIEASNMDWVRDNPISNFTRFLTRHNIVTDNPLRLSIGWKIV